MVQGIYPIPRNDGKAEGKGTISACNIKIKKDLQFEF
jgi:hypothetical protein